MIFENNDCLDVKHSIYTDYVYPFGWLILTVKIPYVISEIVLIYIFSPDWIYVILSSLYN